MSLIRNIVLISSCQGPGHRPWGPISRTSRLPDDCQVDGKTVAGPRIMNTALAATDTDRLPLPSEALTRSLSLAWALLAPIGRLGQRRPRPCNIRYKGYPGGVASRDSAREAPVRVNLRPGPPPEDLPPVCHLAHPESQLLHRRSLLAQTALHPHRWQRLHCDSKAEQNLLAAARRVPVH